MDNTQQNNDTGSSPEPMLLSLEHCLATLTQHLSMELNNHLAEIVGYSELLADKVSGAEDAAYVEKIRSAGVRAMAATRRVQALALVFATGESK